MAVQIFDDRRDRTFWVIGSARNASPLRVVYDVTSRCSPSSINLVFITQCEDSDLWLRMLALINSHLKPGHKLIGLPGNIIANGYVGAPKNFYLEVAKAIGRRMNEPVKADPITAPEIFRIEMEKRNLMLTRIMHDTPHFCTSARRSAPPGRSDGTGLPQLVMQRVWG
jgi:hypothetical protein